MVRFGSHDSQRVVYLRTRLHLFVHLVLFPGFGFLTEKLTETQVLIIPADTLLLDEGLFNFSRMLEKVQVLCL